MRLCLYFFIGGGLSLPTQNVQLSDQVRIKQVSDRINGSSVVCDGKWNSPFELKLSPGKNDDPKFVTRFFGNTFYSLSDDIIAVSKPIAQRHFDIQSRDGQTVLKYKFRDETVTCQDFKHFIIRRYNREQYRKSRPDDEAVWNFGGWLERFAYSLPNIGQCGGCGRMKTSRRHGFRW